VTSKILLIALIRHKLGRCAWLIALWSIALFFIFPVTSAVISSGGHYSEGHPADNLLDFSSVAFLYAVMIAAVVTAVIVFHYLNKKKQIDFFHSQPVGRGTLFWSNYITGAIIFIIPYVVFWSLSLITATLCYTSELLNMGEIAIVFFVNILFYMICYSITVFACNLSGNSAISLTLTTIYLFYFPALYLCSKMMTEIFFKTISINDFFDDIAYKLSPVFYFSRFFINSYYQHVDPLFWIIFHTVTAALIAFSAYLLYKKRSSEAAGKAIAFSAVHPIVKFSLMLIFMLTSGLIFFSVGQGSFGWMAFGIVILGFISFALLNTMLHFDIKSFAKGWRSLLIFSAAFALILTGMHLSSAKFNSITVSAEEIEYIVWTPVNSQIGTNMQNKIVLKDNKNIEAAVALQNLAAEQSDKIKYIYGYNNWHFNMTLHKKQGSEFSRKYVLYEEQLKPYSDSIQKSEEYKNLVVSDTLKKALIADVNINIHKNDFGSFPINNKYLKNGLINALLADAAAFEGNIFENENHNYSINLSLVNSSLYLNLNISSHLPNTMTFISENNIATDIKTDSYKDSTDYTASYPTDHYDYTETNSAYNSGASSPDYSSLKP